jgi:hypothetical protein
MQLNCDISYKAFAPSIYFFIFFLATDLICALKEVIARQELIIYLIGATPYSYRSGASCAVQKIKGDS